MELRLKYDEISSLIEKKAGRALPMAYGGPHTVRISYDVNVLFKNATVGLDLTVDGIEGGDIYLTYSGGAGIDFMVKQAISMARNRPGGEFIEPLEGSRLKLGLGRLTAGAQSQMGAGTVSLLDYIELDDIRFDEQYAIVCFHPKGVN